MTLACVLFLGSAIAEEPNPQELVDTAISEFQAGKYDQALEKLQQVEKTQPDSAFLQNLIGAVYTKKKDYAKAKVAFDKGWTSTTPSFPRSSMSARCSSFRSSTRRLSITLSACCAMPG